MWNAPAAHAGGEEIPAREDSPALAASPETADLESGRRDYALHCGACHGPTGEGDGRLARILTPPPARLSDPALLETRANADLYRAIEQGIPAEGPSEGMAPWGDMLAPEQITNVVAYIRSLQVAAAAKQN